MARGHQHNDVIDLEILENGTLRIETGSISGENHAKADDLVRFLMHALGGPSTSTGKAHEEHHHYHVHQPSKARF